MTARPVLPLVFLLAGCGVDAATANGELGRLQFQLVSDYYLPEHDLTEAPIVTGHEQYIGVELTGKGEDDAGKRADEVEYVVTPDDGVTVGQSGPDGDEGEDDGDGEFVSDVHLTVTEPGEYQLEARLDGETFDRIQLAFDAPAALELSMYTREPWEEDFVALEGSEPHPVAEGTQLAWLPIPVDAAGARLLGDLEADMTADPMTAVVPAANVEHVNEDEVQTFFGAPSLYFVEPGAVTVTVGDTVNPAVGTAAFSVE